MFQNKHLWQPVLCMVYFDSDTCDLFFLPPGSWSGMPPPFSFFEFSPNDTHSQHSTSHRLKWFCMSPTGITQHISHFRLATKYMISILFSTRSSMRGGHFLGTDYFSGISFCNSSVQYSLQKSQLQPSQFSKCWSETRGALQTQWFYREIFMEVQEQIRVSDY